MLSNSQQPCHGDAAPPNHLAPEDFTAERLLSLGYADRESFLRLYPGARCDLIHSEDEVVLVDYYLHGMCAPFALAMQRVTGWSICGIFRPPQWSGSPLHFLCVTPEGRFADARGLDMSAEEAVQGFGEDAFVFPASDVAPLLHHRHPEHHRQADEHLQKLFPELHPGSAPDRAKMSSDACIDARYLLSDTEIGRPMKDFSEAVDAKLSELTISFFFEDPDDDEDRYGDGHYFQFAGETSWNGPYQSEDEAQTEAAELVDRPYATMMELTERLSAPVVAGHCRYTGLFRGVPSDQVRLAYWQEPGESLTRYLMDSTTPEKASVTLGNWGLVPVTIEQTSETLSDLEGQHGLATNSANDEPVSPLTLG